MYLSGVGRSATQLFISSSSAWQRYSQSRVSEPSTPMPHRRPMPR